MSSQLLEILNSVKMLLENLDSMIFQNIVQQRLKVVKNVLYSYLKVIQRTRLYLMRLIQKFTDYFHSKVNLKTVMLKN